MMNFEEIGTHKEIVEALKEMGIDQPTDIQVKTIPHAIEGKDIIGISKTGSGKTLAFSIPILQVVQKGNGVQALVLVPTRELAEQVMKEMRKFGKHMHLHIAAVYGGVGMHPQIEALRRCEVIVATPGRMLDHLQSGAADLSRVRFMVLDEADRMVSMGFIEDVETIMNQTPVQRQTFLFGATIGLEIEALKERQMKNTITLTADVQVEKNYLAQQYYDVDDRSKFSLFVHIFRKEKPQRAIAFCGTRITAEIVARNLRRFGFDADVLHGKMSQSKRLKVIETFHKGRPQLLVATDVAGRGLHIEQVSHIFNYDVPGNPEDYIHRIGRTARAGESGKAITLLAPRDHDNFNAILSRYTLQIEKGPDERFEQLRFDARRNMEDSSSNRRDGGFGQRRQGGYGHPEHRRHEGPSRQGGYSHSGHRSHDPGSSGHSGHEHSGQGQGYSGNGEHSHSEKQHWIIRKAE